MKINRMERSPAALLIIATAAASVHAQTPAERNISVIEGADALYRSPRGEFTPKGDKDNRRAAKPVPAVQQVQIIGVTRKEEMKVIIGSKAFKATLADNLSVAKLRTLLPLRLNMTELNGNEKYHDLFTRLPTNAGQPGTVHAGDILLYGDKTVVLFYKTFKTYYSYTRLGHIENPAGLEAAVGAGDVTVTFQVE